MDPVEMRIGAIGPWHGQIIAVLGLSWLYVNFQSLGTSYSLQTPEFWCSPKVGYIDFFHTWSHLIMVTRPISAKLIFMDISQLSRGSNIIWLSQVWLSKP